VCIFRRTVLCFIKKMSLITWQVLQNCEVAIHKSKSSCAAGEKRQKQFFNCMGRVEKIKRHGKVNVMSARKKNILTISIISAVCLIVSTVCGVLLAKKIGDAPVGGGEIVHSGATDELPASEDSVTNILLFGVDEGGMRSDTIMLMSINGYTDEISVLSIPRDTRIPVGNGHQKVNAAIGIGAQEVKKNKDDGIDIAEDYAIRKIKDLTGLPVHRYVTIDFDGFKKIIDALGGVDFEIPFHMKYDDPYQNLHIDLKPGMQHLDGQAAHDFVRFRQGNPGYPGYATGDLGRIEAQQAFFRAIVDQKARPEYLGKAGELYDIMSKYVKTNYAYKEVMRNLGVAANLTSDNVRMIQLPGQPQMIGGVSYFIADEKAMEELANTVFSPNRKSPLPKE